MGFWLNSMVANNIVISGRFYVQTDKLSSLYQEYRYVGVISHTFYCNFCRGIEYSLLYQEYCYIEDCYIGVPLSVVFRTEMCYKS